MYKQIGTWRNLFSSSVAQIEIVWISHEWSQICHNERIIKDQLIQSTCTNKYWVPGDLKFKKMWPTKFDTVKPVEGGIRIRLVL